MRKAWNIIISIEAAGQPYTGEFGYNYGITVSYTSSLVVIQTSALRLQVNHIQVSLVIIMASQ